MPRLDSALASIAVVPPLNSNTHAALTILIIDDDPTVTETFARLLQLQGYGAVIAESAEAAFGEVARARPDAILLDLRMPLVDGLSFLQQLRAMETQTPTPVAIVTGDYFLDEDSVRELRALGATLYFKPLWADDLINVIQLLVGTIHKPPA